MLAWDLGDADPFPGRIGGRPVGQVLVKLDDRRAAVFGQGGAQAVIEREPAGRHRWRYRYLPSTMIDCTPAGAVRREGGAGKDPFGYLDAGMEAAWMGEFHSEREWLEATKYCLYPDAVVSVAAQLFWDGPMAAREARFSPDMILCAAPGWAFEPPGEPSGAHGYLTYESAHIPFLVAGPNVRGGIVVTNAVRTADLVPTVLDLLGIRFDPERFDGKPVKGFLKAEGEEKPPRPGESLQAPWPSSRTAPPNPTRPIYVPTTHGGSRSAGRGTSSPTPATGGTICRIRRTSTSSGRICSASSIGRCSPTSTTCTTSCTRATGNARWPRGSGS